MNWNNILDDKIEFSRSLYEKMAIINPGVSELELYEFRYALEAMTPENGWDSVVLESQNEIEQKVNRRDFFESIQLKPRDGNRLVLDPTIVKFTWMIFAGLVSGFYPVEWVCRHFYFDIRGFLFFHRTTYFTDSVQSYLGGTPLRCFEPRQRRFDREQAIGYKAFKEANRDVDEYFMDCVLSLARIHGKPILVGIAGPTAAGKTEIVARLHEKLIEAGQTVTTLEMDHFLTDREYREQQGIDSLGREALHFNLFLTCLEQLRMGRKVTTPRYDFVSATSSHDLEGHLKPGLSPLEVDPADIIFLEGNFPFLLAEVAGHVAIKVVYLTDDAVRMKRKWKRDMDYRKKYDREYFCNRYFREQFLMAESVYIPQMMTCDLVVDTTGGCVWASRQARQLLELGGLG